MSQNHSVFTEPADPTVKIWRYMAFWKFISLLEDRSLYFARADRLGDPFEGSFPEENIAQRPSAYAELIKKYEDQGLFVRCPHIERPLSFLEAQSVLRQWVCQWTFVNCWHINELESAAMWRLYGDGSPTVAIQCLCQ